MYIYKVLNMYVHCLSVQDKILDYIIHNLLLIVREDQYFTIDSFCFLCFCVVLLVLLKMLYFNEMLHFSSILSYKTICDSLFDVNTQLNVSSNDHQYNLDNFEHVILNKSTSYSISSYLVSNY